MELAFPEEDRRIINVNVPLHKRSERIDIYLARELANLSRTKIKRLIQEDKIRLNGHSVRASTIIGGGDLITIEIPSSGRNEIEPEDIPLDIVFEDQNILIINKPPGMVVHPAHGNFSGTLVNALLFHFKELSEIGGRTRPGIVHRLDRDTSGLIIVAKDDSSHSFLSMQFHERLVEKEYTAIVWGFFNEREGVIEFPVGRSIRDRKKMDFRADGKMAATRYRVEEEGSFLSLVSLFPRSGRTHQLRVHLSRVGHPVFGDGVYGGRNRQLRRLDGERRKVAARMLKILTRQALHARAISFIHPATRKKLRFEIPPPDDFQSVLKMLYD